MIITYDEITNCPTINLDIEDMNKLNQGEVIYSYDDGIALIMVKGNIHVLSEYAGEYAIMKPASKYVMR